MVDALRHISSRCAAASARCSASVPFMVTKLDSTVRSPFSEIILALNCQVILSLFVLLWALMWYTLGSIICVYIAGATVGVGRQVSPGAAAPCADAPSVNQHGKDKIKSQTKQ